MEQGYSPKRVRKFIHSSQKLSSHHSGNAEIPPLSAAANPNQILHSRTPLVTPYPNFAADQAREQGSHTHEDHGQDCDDGGPFELATKGEVQREKR